MQTIKEANVQKCLDLPENFHEAVTLDQVNQELREKKVQARQALDHLGRLLYTETGDIRLEKAAVCDSRARACK